MSSEQETFETARAQDVDEVTEDNDDGSTSVVSKDVGKAGSGSAKAGGDEEVTTEELNIQGRTIQEQKPEKSAAGTKKADTSPPPHHRTKSNQRWMKLRTTVQLSGAIQKSKPSLKREDSFLKRFSTRQVPELQRDESVVTVLGSDDAESEAEMDPLQERLRSESAGDTLLDMGSDSEYSSDDDEDPPYDNQWEFKLLAEELDKREAAMNRATSFNSHWQATSRRFLQRRFGLSFQVDDFGDIPSRSASVRVRKKEKKPFVRSSSVPESSTSSNVFDTFSSSMKKTKTTLGTTASPIPPNPDFYDSNDSSFL